MRTKILTNLDQIKDIKKDTINWQWADMDELKRVINSLKETVKETLVSYEKDIWMREMRVRYRRGDLRQEIYYILLLAYMSTIIPVLI